MVMLNDGDHDCELVMYGCDNKAGDITRGEERAGRGVETVTYAAGKRTSACSEVLETFRHSVIKTQCLPTTPIEQPGNDAIRDCYAFQPE